MSVSTPPSPTILPQRPRGEPGPVSAKFRGAPTDTKPAPIHRSLSMHQSLPPALDEGIRAYSPSLIPQENRTSVNVWKTLSNLDDIFT